jgi:hypothetical protein
LNEAKTFDPNRAARFLYKYDADIAAMKLLPSKSCVWRAREHMFYDSGDDLDSIDPDCLPSC